MKENNKYPTKNFYVGEIYLYTKFGNLLVGNTQEECINKIKSFSESGAINFQQAILDKYIDWENRREYTGFLTIFYKQGNKYICLHDGNEYELNSDIIIENLLPLNELMPKIDIKFRPHISMADAIYIFDTLFNKNIDEARLYVGQRQQITDFYVGDLVLPESYKKEELPDSRRHYIDLAHHQMLGKSTIEISSHGKDDYSYCTYRCLFLRDGVDLYNINNNQFYNKYEDEFESIMPFQEYMKTHDIEMPYQTISIPKTLKLFKKTL